MRVISRHGSGLPIQFEPELGESSRARLWQAFRFHRSSRFYFLQALTQVSQFHASAKVRALRARARKLAGLRT